MPKNHNAQNQPHNGRGDDWRKMIDTFTGKGAASPYKWDDQHGWVPRDFVAPEPINSSASQGAPGFWEGSSIAAWWRTKFPDHPGQIVLEPVPQEHATIEGATLVSTDALTVPVGAEGSQRREPVALVRMLARVAGVTSQVFGAVGDYLRHPWDPDLSVGGVANPQAVDISHIPRDQLV